MIATALCEAMALACGDRVRALALTVELTEDDAPVGTFLKVEATVRARRGATIAAAATATSAGRPIAAAQGRFELEQPV